MDTLRTAYQRAVQIPLNNVEAIWQEYNQFENSMNKMTVSRAPFSSIPTHSFDLPSERVRFLNESTR